MKERKNKNQPQVHTDKNLVMRHSEQREKSFVGNIQDPPHSFEMTIHNYLRVFRGEVRIQKMDCSLRSPFGPPGRHSKRERFSQAKSMPI